MDEKSFRKRHRYLTLVNDLDRRRVLYVAEGRRQQSLDGFWPTLSEQQRQAIQAVAMDLWDPYVAKLCEHLPLSESKIVFDKFPIAQRLAKAVDKVGREENKRLRQAGDEGLVGSKHLWRRHPASFSKKQWRVLEELRQSDLKTARAWALKETVMRLFEFRLSRVARKFFRRWYYWATHSRLQPIQAAGRMMNERLENILSY